MPDASAIGVALAPDSLPRLSSAEPRLDPNGRWASDPKARR
jgi:hypothetical protein